MRFSIRYKLIVGYLLIFCMGFTMIGFFVSNIIANNNQKIIKKDLLSVQKDTTLYLKQYLVLKQIKENEDNFIRHVEEIAGTLSLKIEGRVILYSKDGTFLFDSAYEKGHIFAFEDIEDIGEMENDEDLKLAIKNKAAYKMVNMNNKYLSVFSFPIFIKNKNIGIVRYTRDYTDMFHSSKELLKMMNICILSVFLVIFIFLILLSTKITVPVIDLSKVSKEVAKGNFDIDVRVSSTKDEMEELTENFNKMKRQIKNQMNMIKKDRDNLKKLQNHRKAFFDNATHEMKTPLTIISGYAQIMLKKGFDDKVFFKKAMNKIYDESDRLYKMVLDLLEMSKMESDIQTNEMKETNLSKVLRSVCEDMKIKADKYHIHIDKEIEEDLYILGNEYELRQMFINIIDNAIKYGDIKAIIKVKLLKDDDHIHMIISDQGKGIPKDKLDKIFEPFYRIHHIKDKGSSGLGLCIVKGIVKNHEGDIEIISEENIGTNVHVKIPLKVYNLATTI